MNERPDAPAAGGTEPAPARAQLLGLGLLVAGILLVRPIYLSAAHPAVGFGLAALGAALMLFRPTRARAALAVLALAGALALDVVYVDLEPRFSGGSATIARGAALILAPVVERVAAGDGRAIVFHESENTGFLAGPQFGGLRELSVVGGVLALVAIATLGRRALLWLPPAFLLFAGLAVLRFAAGILTYLGADDETGDGMHLRIAALWSPWLSILTCLAASATGGELLRTLLAAAPRREPGRIRAFPATVGLLAAGCAGAAAFLELPGERSAGRVLLDDRLSGVWEPAGRLLDTDRYGDFSAYSFATLTEFVGRRYDLTVNADEPYTAALLADYDVLVLKTPHDVLPEAETAAILRWAKEGGSLFLIGDHTDLGGMNSFLNAFARRAGIELGNDSVEHADLPGYVRWQRPAALAHPIAAGLPPLTFMTGCSLRVTGSAVPVLALRRVVAREGDYSRNSNFGTVPPRPDTAQGTLVGAAAGRIGDGRVLVFSDSTVFSSFAFFQDGHDAFVERAFAWLARRGSRGFALGAAALLAALAWLVSFPWSAGAASRSAFLAAGVICASAAAVGASRLSGVLLEPAPVEDPTPTIGFVTEGGAAVLPAVLGTQPEGVDDENFMTFVQIPLRLGLETRVVERSPARLAGLAALVVLNPDAELDPAGPDPAWIRGVREWVRGGGQLVVLAQSKHAGHAHPREGDYLAELHARPLACSLPGVEAFQSDVGRGSVLLLRGSEHFSSTRMGHCMALPDHEQRAIYDFCHALWVSRGLDRSVRERQVYWPSPAAARGAG